MKVREWQGEVVFLHEVGPGAADRSYGIQVAKLAGLPDAVITRASEVLKSLEENQSRSDSARQIDDLPLFNVQRPASAASFANKNNPAIEQLAEIFPDEMTPREALEALYALKALLDQKGES